MSNKKIKAREDFKGIDWSLSLMRPGCQDHLKYPSRRGNTRVPHMVPIGISDSARRAKPGHEW